MERKVCKDQERLKIKNRSTMPEQARYFSNGQGILSGLVAVEDKKVVAAARNLQKARGKQLKK